MSDWYQQQLTPPQVLELNIRLGVIPETDHLQAMVELKDPTTGILLAQASSPHTRVANFPHVLEWCKLKAEDYLAEHCEPF